MNTIEQYREELDLLNRWLKVYTRDRCWTQMDEISNQIRAIMHKIQGVDVND